MSVAPARASRGNGARPVTPGLLLLAVALGTGLLAGGYYLQGAEAWMAGLGVVPAVLWAAARRSRSILAADVLLATFVLLAGLGLWWGVGAGWMAAAVVAGLAAWDLERFEQRLALAGQVVGRDTLEARHLVRLLPVAATGLVLALVGAYARLAIGFLPVLLLGALAIAGLARAIVYLRRDDD